jgi:hypothetical protein
MCLRQWFKTRDSRVEYCEKQGVETEQEKQEKLLEKVAECFREQDLEVPEKYTSAGIKVKVHMFDDLVEKAASIDEVKEEGKTVSRGQEAGDEKEAVGEAKESDKEKQSDKPKESGEGKEAGEAFLRTKL